MRGTTHLASFDGNERLLSSVARPETYRDLLALISTEERVIARGAGLSYSAASFGSAVLAIDLTRFDRILAFDEASGLVTVEPGVTIGDLSAFLASKGRYLPAIPGYPTITVGGCIAFDVHGKSQLHSGNFGAWVQELTLVHRDHGALLCSGSQHTDVFELTLGGMGLTGVIVRACLRTAPLPGPAIEVTSVPAQNLLAAAEIMQTRSEDADCLYSWNNLNLRGARFGSGIVYVERFVEAVRPPRPAPEPKLDIRTRLPFRLWNRPATAAVLGAYGQLHRSRGSSRTSLHAGLFPIRGKEVYFAGFGAAGFREYQVILPTERWEEFVSRLSQLLGEARLPVTLGSLKLFKGEQRYLRFSASGICLALDVPALPGSAALFAQLDGLTMDCGGTVNAAKDSRLDAETCKRLFGEYQQFCEALQRYDPQRRCASQVRSRLGV